MISTMTAGLPALTPLRFPAALAVFVCHAWMLTRGTTGPEFLRWIEGFGHELGMHEEPLLHEDHGQGHDQAGQGERERERDQRGQAVDDHVDLPVVE